MQNKKVYLRNDFDTNPPSLDPNQNYNEAVSYLYVGGRFNTIE